MQFVLHTLCAVVKPLRIGEERSIVGTMKRSFHEKNWRSDPQFRRLCKALLSCKTEKEVADFLRDVATLSELKAWSERLEAATLLAQNIPYREIAKRTGLSTATITRIATFLQNGSGYKGAMKKL